MICIIDRSFTKKLNENLKGVNIENKEDKKSISQNNLEFNKINFFFLIFIKKNIKLI